MSTVRSGNVKLVDWQIKYPYSSGRVHQSRPSADSKDWRLKTRESVRQDRPEGDVHSGDPSRHVCFSRQPCARNRHSWPSFVLFYLVLVVALPLGAAPLTCLLHLSHQRADKSTALFVCLAGTCFLKQEKYGTLCQCLSILSRLHAVVSWELGSPLRRQGDAELPSFSGHRHSVWILCAVSPEVLHFDSKANLSLKSKKDYVCGRG